MSGIGRDAVEWKITALLRFFAVRPQPGVDRAGEPRPYRLAFGKSLKAESHVQTFK